MSNYRNGSAGVGKSGRRVSKGASGVRLLENEPRIVTAATIEQLKKSGASGDLIAAAERAARTNPSG
jgi:hypothetical protein